MLETTMVMGDDGDGDNENDGDDDADDDDASSAILIRSSSTVLIRSSQLTVVAILKYWPVTSLNQIVVVVASTWCQQAMLQICSA